MLNHEMTLALALKDTQGALTKAIAQYVAEPTASIQLCFILVDVLTALIEIKKTALDGAVQREAHNVRTAH